MLDQLLQVVCHVLLELADALRAENVRDSLAFAGMFGAIARVEEASLNGDEGVIIVAVKPCLRELLLMRIRGEQSDDRKNVVECEKG